MMRSARRSVACWLSTVWKPAPSKGPASAVVLPVKMWKNIWRKTTLKRLLLNLQHNPLWARGEKRVPMTRLRKRVAERLLEAKNSTAMLTTFNEVNMKPIMDLRKQYGEVFEKRHGIRLGFMSFYVKAVVEALKRYPEVNASIDGDDVVYHNYFDVSMAVSTPRGLVTPVLRDVDTLGMADIEKKLKNWPSKAATAS